MRKISDFRYYKAVASGLGIEKGAENEKCRYSSLIIHLMGAKKEKLLVEAAANPELLEELYREYRL